jgi:hypothetical protein
MGPVICSHPRSFSSIFLPVPNERFLPPRSPGFLFTMPVNDTADPHTVPGLIQGPVPGFRNEAPVQRVHFAGVHWILFLIHYIPEWTVF